MTRKILLLALGVTEESGLQVKTEDMDGPHPVYWLQVEDIVSRGYAVVAYCNQEVALDWHIVTVATNGVFKAFGYADLKHRRPTEWGILSAWAWGMSRIVDWIETEPLLDAKRIASVGRSRNGKTSLLAGVTDSRFVLVVSYCSGCSGAKLNHMACEGSESITAISIAFSWFAPNYMKYMGHNRDAQMPFDHTSSWRSWRRGFSMYRARARTHGRDGAASSPWRCWRAGAGTYMVRPGSSITASRSRISRFTPATSANISVSGSMTSLAMTGGAIWTSRMATAGTCRDRSARLVADGRGDALVSFVSQRQKRERNEHDE